MPLLDIVINSNLAIVITVIICIFVLVIRTIITNLKEKNHKSEMELLRRENLIKEKDTTISNIQIEIQGKAQELSGKMFEDWKTRELDSYKKAIDKLSLEQAATLLQQWITENEDRIRKSAAHKSLKVNLGKVSEHLLPFSEQFKDFNPKDARFIGSPIDLIVFDGCTDEKEFINIYFIEVKTGTSALSKPQKRIRDAVINKRVGWLVMSVKDSDLNLELES